MTAKAWVVAVLCGFLLAGTAAAQCVSTLVPVSQPVVFPNRAAGPLVWTGSQFGLAKQDADASTNAIWFAVYDTNLNQIHGDSLIAFTTLAGPRIVLWNGTEYAVFFQRADFQIVFQRVDANGNAIGGPSAVAPGHPLGPGEEFDAAWDPSRKAYVVIHTIVTGFERGVWLTTVAPDGTQKSDDPITFFIADPVYPHVAVTSAGNIGIIFSRLVNGGQQELAFATVTPGTPPTNISTIRAGGSNPRMATDGKFFFVVYTAPVTGGSVLRSIKFDTAGRVVTADAQLLSVGQDAIAFSVVANTTLGEWGVLYVSYPVGVANSSVGETRLRRIPFSGATQTDAPFASDGTKRNLAPQSELTWNGSAYAASIGRVLSRIEGTESYLARHCPFFVRAIATPAVSDPNVPVTLTVIPSGGVPPYSATWSFGDISANQSGPVVTHTYRQTGTYTATVTATDTNGSTTTSTVTITIANLRHRAARHP
jgi:PKD domain